MASCNKPHFTVHESPFTLLLPLFLSAREGEHAIEHTPRLRPQPVCAQSPMALIRTGFFGSRAGTGFSGCCRLGTKSSEAPPGNRLMLGYFMIDSSNSMSTG